MRLRQAASESATQITISTSTTVANQVASGAVQSLSATTAVSVWVAGKERALRDHYQDQPSSVYLNSIPSPSIHLIHLLAEKL